MLALLGVAVALGAVRAEVFTAMTDVAGLLGAEARVTGLIDQYISMEELRLERLRSAASSWGSKAADAGATVGAVAGNPVNAYLLIRRLTADWDALADLMRTNSAPAVLANITEHRHGSGVGFPGEEDLKGAADAILRLQDTYRLPTKDLADGHIADSVPRAPRLSAGDCYELGRVAYNKQDYYHTVLWMREALERLEGEAEASADEAEVLEHLGFGLYQQGNVRHALALTRRLLRLAPNHPRAQGNVDFYLGELKGEKVGELSELPPEVNLRPDDGAVAERDSYEALCRGDVPVDPAKAAKLYCYYKRDRAFLWLAPVKVEIAHLDPLAVKFVDVISDEEVEVIKRLAGPKLRRATVQNSVTGELETASYRVSKSAWLKADEDQVIQTINRRIADMTNLNMATAEDLQIANYGLGGHYDPHFDFARKEETNAFKGLGTGNRIATILFYMEAPEAGGATVFPELGLTVSATRHDCAFWYNLRKDGEGDMRTRHAACPVLAGQKWVANKWIHERGQEDPAFRPCGLSPTEAEERVADEPRTHFPF